MEVHDLVSIKRSHPDAPALKPVKFIKTDSMKENVPPETHLENALGQNDYSHDVPNGEKTTPKKLKHIKEEPITPSTNFKMLINLAATLDYANCNVSKSGISNLNLVQYIEKPRHALETLNSPVIKKARKEKSLSIICTRFLAMYPLYPKSDTRIVVSLDEACWKLGVERRRLYDIVNVFESIDMLNKLAKNQYLWFGKNNLLKALQKMKTAAMDENVLTKLQYVLSVEENTPAWKNSCILDDVQDFNKNFENKKSTPSAPDALRYPSPVPELRKEKSLAIMSQKFLMLFLVSPTKVISLGVAAKVLNGFQKNEGGAQIKTQIRRLYDIANVLSSIGLIQKEVTIGQSGRKPAFKYIGPDLDKINEPIRDVRTFQNKSLRKSVSKSKPRNLVRHSSFQEICAVAEIEHQRLCLGETPNSAPPFEKGLQYFNESFDKTSFTDLNLKAGNSLESNCLREGLGSDPVIGSNKNSNDDLRNQIESSSNEVKSAQPEMKPFIMPKKSNLKMITLPKQALPSDGTYFILNTISNEASKASNSIGTFLLVNPSTQSKLVKESIPDKTSENKVKMSQTVKLSAEQRDLILKSLNVSLSAGQIAAIQLEGSSKSPTSEGSSRRNLLKIIEEHEDKSSSTTIRTDALKPVVFDEEEGSNSLNDCCSRNYSPSSSSSRLDSPISIPSGYTTPIPSSLSDLPLLTNSETDSILKKLDNQSNSAESNPNTTESRLDFANIPKHNTQNSRTKLLTLAPMPGINTAPEKDRLSSNCSNNLPMKKIQTFFLSTKFQNIAPMPVIEGKPGKDNLVSNSGNRNIQGVFLSSKLPTLAPVPVLNEQSGTNSQLPNCNNLSLRQIQNFSISTNSSSSDSLNAEVSDILKSGKLDAYVANPKPFLIDEKTILSPIKIPKINKSKITSPIVTLPYTTPETILVYHSQPSNYQNGINTFSIPISLLKVGSGTNIDGTRVNSSS